MVRYSLTILIFASSGAQVPQAPAVPSTPSASDRQMEAAAKQRAASQLQTGSAPQDSFFSTGWTSPSMLPPPTQSVAGCRAMEPSESEPLITAAASRQSLNPDLLKAVIRQESAFYPCAVSGKGAMGLMQLMPETAETFKTSDPFDPAQNIESGARYLKQMLTRFNGDVKLALAAYNAGPERVDGSKIPDIPETRDYVDSIVKALNGASAESAK